MAAGSLPKVSTETPAPATPEASTPFASTPSGLEQGIVGLWHRDRISDAADMYLRINPDRTACKWEEAHGSDVRKRAFDYVNWNLDLANSVGQNKFRLILIHSTIGESPWIFNASTRQIGPEGFDTLNYSPSSENKICDH
jgi:hypothetical protein